MYMVVTDLLLSLRLPWLLYRLGGCCRGCCGRNEPLKQSCWTSIKRIYPALLRRNFIVPWPLARMEYWFGFNYTQGTLGASSSTCTVLLILHCTVDIVQGLFVMCWPLVGYRLRTWCPVIAAPTGGYHEEGRSSACSSRTLCCDHPLENRIAGQKYDRKRSSIYIYIYILCIIYC